MASAAALAAASTVVAADASADDERFMRMALDEARQGDFPFGAVIVRNGQVLARGRNLGKTNGDPTAHGEMMAIRHCLADHGSDAIKGSTLYTSGEPCAMCMGAILWCHVGRLVFAASVAATGNQDRSDHALKCRRRRQGPLRADRDHGRRPGGRSHAAVCEINFREPLGLAAKSSALLPEMVRLACALINAPHPLSAIGDKIRDVPGDFRMSLNGPKRTLAGITSLSEWARASNTQAHNPTASGGQATCHPRLRRLGHRLRRGVGPSRETRREFGSRAARAISPLSARSSA